MLRKGIYKTLPYTALNMGALGQNGTLMGIQAFSSADNPAKHPTDNEENGVMNSKNEQAYKALVEECRHCLSEVKGTEREARLDMRSGSDLSLMASFGPFTRDVARRANMSLSSVSYHLSKDGRAQSENPGAGTCRRWWAKGVRP